MKIHKDLTINNPNQDVEPSTEVTNEEGETVQKFNPCNDNPTCGQAAFKELSIGVTDDTDAGDIGEGQKKTEHFIGGVISPDIKWDNKPPVLSMVKMYLRSITITMGEHTIQPVSETCYSALLGASRDMEELFGDAELSFRKSTIKQ